MMMKKYHLFSICLLAGMLSGVSPAWSASPSPKAKQLYIGQLTYWSDIWSNTTARSWFANHNSWTIFDYGYGGHTSIASSIAAMQVINPSFKAFKYTIFAAYANKGTVDYLPDTTDLKAHADSLGVNYDSLFVWTGSKTGDSVGLRQNPFNSWDATVQPSHKIIYSYASANRVGLDFRNPNVGKVLGHYWRMIANAYGAQGVMTDEECPVGRTGIMVDWYYPVPLPFFRPKIGTTYPNWRYGDATSHWQKPFSTSMGDTAIADSMRRARDGWQKIAGDTLRNHNMEYIPNWAATGSPTGAVAQAAWDYEVRHVTVNNTRGALLGEYSDYCPSVAAGPQGLNTERGLNRLVKACQDIKDSAVTLYVWPLRVGICDSVAYGSQSYMTRARSRLNGLGTMLECLWPGTSTYKFGPGPGNSSRYDNQFLLSHSVCGSTVNDTIECWSEAWGKYFGYPASSGRRDTSITGTDGAGQTYTIHRLALASQQTTTDTLTYVIGRYCRGTSVGATSAVNVSLPSGTWYLLNDDGTWTAASSPISIRNGEWKIFSANISLANNGLGVSTPSIILTSPNGGEKWAVGSVHLITWSASGTYSNVLIELSRDGGSSWSTLTTYASSVATAWSWTLSGACADNAKLRVTLTGSQGTALDISDQNFAIVYGAPALNSPVDGAAAVGASTSFNWSAVTGATGYRFMVSNTSGFIGTQLAYQDITGTTATLSGSWTSGSITFQSGAAYYWRVLANPSAGCTNVSWSTTRRFVYQGAAPVDSIPPDTVHWLNYVPGANDGEIDLTWTAPGDDGMTGQADHYDLRYSKESFTEADWESLPSYSGMPAPLTGGSEQTATLQGFDPGVLYYICMKAIDQAGNSSPPSQIILVQAKEPFSTGGNDLTVTLAGPADHATVHTSHPLLSVTNSDSSTITFYYFDVAHDSLFADMVISSPSVARQAGSTTDWEVTERLGSGRLYYWRATADRVHYSTIRSFSVQTAPHVYPNPYEPQSTPRAVFTELPSQGSLFLMTVSGSPVRYWSSLNGDDIVWDGTNQSGHSVASGTYLWYIEGTDFKGKLVVIR